MPGLQLTTMKDFLKYTLASCLGMTLAMMFLGFLMIAGLAALVAMAGAGGSSPATVKHGSVLALDFTQPYPERKNNLPAGSLTFSEEDIPGLHDVARLIREAAADEKVNGIFIENGMGSMGPSSAKIILDALSDFKASDKFIAAYGDFFTQQGYYLASPADHITLHPVGTVDFRGFASYIPFFKGLIDKIGLDIQVYYAGNFKSATEPFRRTEMSEENKLQTREFLTDVYQLYLKDIAEIRGIPYDTLHQIAWTFRIKAAEDALANRLVDEIGTRSDCERWMNAQMKKGAQDKVTYVDIDEYARSHPAKAGDAGAKDRIAIVFAEGEIVSDQEDYGVIDDDRYVKLLRDLRRQDDVKAVVLRINSPGGSILSAENIYQQLEGLKKDGKTLVVSMGDYAASGGYYLSALADSIFAQPNTLTGSIGVFSLFPNPSRALEDKLGVRFDTVRTGPYSTDFTVMFPWSDREHTYMQSRTDAYYEMFLKKVADGREMTRDAVHAVAQGRIWSGQRAVDLGLVDKLGTLEDAVRSAARLANLEEYRTQEYPIFQNPLQKIISDLLQDQKLEVEVAVKMPVGDITRFLRHVESGEPMARLPYGIDPVR